ncbi:hypothetical protein [Halovivax sp.]|uniref:hypothetical protein n=1 Tax=Halovivax sp. TaxID=1935978 RepID=UPI0025BD3E74|nr:hypothetical protein [Halovivax sp.]
MSERNRDDDRRDERMTDHDEGMGEHDEGMTDHDHHGTTDRGGSEMTESGHGSGSGRTTIHDDDRGKTVYNEHGDEIGVVTEVRHGTAHVDPDPGLTDSIKAKLGWGDIDDDTYPLQEDAIAHIDDDGVHLRGNL